MSVDHDKDVKFYRFRREETSIWAMKSQLDTVQTDVDELSTLKAEVSADTAASLAAAAAASAAEAVALKADVATTTGALSSDVEDVANRVDAIESKLAAVCSPD